MSRETARRAKEAKMAMPEPERGKRVKPEPERGKRVKPEQENGKRVNSVIPKKGIYHRY